MLRRIPSVDILPVDSQKAKALRMKRLNALRTVSLRLEEKENIPENSALLHLRRGNRRLRELGIMPQVPAEGQKKVPKRIQKWALLEQYLGHKPMTNYSPEMVKTRKVKFRANKGATASKEPAQVTTLQTQLRSNNFNMDVARQYIMPRANIDESVHQVRKNIYFLTKVKSKNQA